MSGGLFRGWARSVVTVTAALLPLLAACGPHDVTEAEAKKDVAWLAADGSAQAVAALGRLADTQEKAKIALEKRPPADANAYVAAWAAVLRGAPWGTALLRTALGDPTRAEVASSALTRRDPHLAPLVPDLERAVERLSAGHHGSILAGVLASVGPAAHAQVERRLVDPKTRGAMCDGIGTPEASGDAKSVVLAVPPEARDHASCVSLVLSMAKTENVLLDWLAQGAEPGLLSALAKSDLPCPRVAAVWEKGLAERPEEAHAALAVPLKIAIGRCTSLLDPVLADLLAKAPRSRACIMQAIDPYSSEIGEMKATCRALRQGTWLSGESARTRELAGDALAHGCASR